MRHQYKVIPFIGQSKGQLSSSDVATQLSAVINAQAAEGWEFCQLSDVNVEVQPGCIAGILGAKAQYMRFDQLIFRTERDVPTRSVTPATRGRRAEVKRTTAESDRTLSQGQRSRSDEPIAVTSKHLEVWRQKSDEQVREAVGMLNKYTNEGQQVILSEYQRRALQPTTEAERAALVAFKTSGTALTNSGNFAEHYPEEILEDQDALSYCYHCGADVPAGSRSCAECGKTL